MKSNQRWERLGDNGASSFGAMIENGMNEPSTLVYSMGVFCWGGADLDWIFRFCRAALGRAADGHYPPTTLTWRRWVGAIVFTVSSSAFQSHSPCRKWPTSRLEFHGVEHTICTRDCMHQPSNTRSNTSKSRSNILESSLPHRPIGFQRLFLLESFPILVSKLVYNSKAQ